MIAAQDFELAKQLMNNDFKFVEQDLDENGDPDGLLIGKKFFHLEGIFLDLTDRTQAHPKVPFAPYAQYNCILPTYGFHIPLVHQAAQSSWQ